MNVFRYRNRETGLKILTEMELPLASPDKLNDPFEFSPVVDSDDITRTRAIEMIKQDQLFDLWISQPHIRYGTRDWWRQYYYSHLDQIVDELWGHLGAGTKWLQANFAKETAKFWLFGCFSYVYDSTLMWAHYAESHEGIVIEFDLDLPPFNNSASIKILPVECRDNLFMRPVFMETG